MSTESLATWGPIVVMIVIFYFLLYRPQKNAQKKRKAMLDSLKKGNEVITIGGIYGKIESLDDKTVELLIAPNTVIKVSRSAINGVDAKKA